MSSWRERVENFLLGGTLTAWGLRGAIEFLQRPAPVFAAICGLNLVVGLLVVIRSPVRRQGNWWNWTMATPCVVIAMVVFRLAPNPIEWSLPASTLFCLGTLLTVTSLVALGRSFAIFPGLREVMTGGPYRFVRHPAYVGECLMAVACFLADPGWAIGLSTGLIPLLLVLRINAEERELKVEESYVAYCEHVRWRLIPGVW